ncbi:hypothetical protein HPB48_007691 [Haemaphysalis longicornis]|uniref:Uncharacterized protein n=1 Tax=Haemaphysalis longicornis TaxID=44386 RepID=A0A9J6G5J2_HAELO|nr:hypothetical protein HPB48_007691 [Haemaphysalis longicornis]
MGALLGLSLAQALHGSGGEKCAVSVSARRRKRGRKIPIAANAGTHWLRKRVCVRLRLCVGVTSLSDANVSMRPPGVPIGWPLHGRTRGSAKSASRKEGGGMYIHGSTEPWFRYTVVLRRPRGFFAADRLDSSTCANWPMAVSTVSVPFPARVSGGPKEASAEVPAAVRFLGLTSGQRGQLGFIVLRPRAAFAFFLLPHTGRVRRRYRPAGYAPRCPITPVWPFCTRGQHGPGASKSARHPSAPHSSVKDGFPNGLPRALPAARRRPGRQHVPTDLCDYSFEGEQHVCGRLRVRSVLVGPSDVFVQVPLVSLKQECRLAQVLHEEGQFYLLVKELPVSAVGQSELSLASNVTVLPYTYQLARGVHQALQGCQQEAQKRSDYGYGGGSAYTSSAYMVKTVKYYYPAPSYGKPAPSGQAPPSLRAARSCAGQTEAGSSRYAGALVELPHVSKCTI